MLLPEVAAALSNFLSDEKSKDKTFGLLSKDLKHILYAPDSCVKISNFPSLLLKFSSNLIPLGLDSYIDNDNHKWVGIITVIEIASSLYPEIT